MSAACLVRWLEQRSLEELAHETLCREKAGDGSGARLFSVLASHREELLADLRAGAAAREADRRDLNVIWRDAATQQARPRKGPWGVGHLDRECAAYGATLGDALAGFEDAEKFVAPPDPGRN